MCTFCIGCFAQLGHLLADLNELRHTEYSRAIKNICLHTRNFCVSFVIPNVLTSLKCDVDCVCSGQSIILFVLFGRFDFSSNERRRFFLYMFRSAFVLLPQAKILEI